MEQVDRAGDGTGGETTRWNKWREQVVEQIEKQVKIAREEADETQRLLITFAGCHHPTCSLFQNNYRLLTIHQN
jgi:hypothetical protein